MEWGRNPLRVTGRHHALRSVSLFCNGDNTGRISPGKRCLLSRARRSHVALERREPAKGNQRAYRHHVLTPRFSAKPALLVHACEQAELPSEEGLPHLPIHKKTRFQEWHRLIGRKTLGSISVNAAHGGLSFEHVSLLTGLVVVQECLGQTISYHATSRCNTVDNDQSIDRIEASNA